MMRRTGYGISVEVPVGWSAALVRRLTSPEADVSDGLHGPDAASPDAASPEGRATADPRPLLVERTLPVLHVSTRPVPDGVGDFGSGAVEVMGPEDVFVALVEYGSDLAGTGLFERQGVPRLAPSQFATNRMPREIPGRSASQHFFSAGGRAFCLYTVLGSHGRRMGTVPRAAKVAASLAIVPAATMHARGVRV
jgi:hypothetical protein